MTFQHPKSKHFNSKTHTIFDKFGPLNSFEEWNLQHFHLYTQNVEDWNVYDNEDMAFEHNSYFESEYKKWKSRKKKKVAVTL